MSRDPVESITLILSPYHVGIRDHRVGAGPARILQHGLVERLRALDHTGHSVTVKMIEPVNDFEGEIGRSFEVIRRIAVAVDDAVHSKSFPIILAGNCNASVGVAAALNSIDDFDVVWFDAHADLDSPDEALSGYFDGMGVSMLSGESWKALTRTVPGHRSVPLNRFIFCGTRDLSDDQRRKLMASSARAVWGNAEESVGFAERLAYQLGESPGKQCLVHIDLDCLDTSVGQVNEYAAPGGLTKDELLHCLDVVSKERIPVALTVASFNPELEGGDEVADAAVNAILRLMLRVKE